MESEINVFRRLFKPRRGHENPPTRGFSGAPIAPDSPVAVIGDIHGRRDALDGILDKLDHTHPGARLVFAGDYIDRGPESAAVLDRLYRLSVDRPDTVFLLGNHEEMLLRFLSDPAGNGPFWLRHGGVNTLASFGLEADDRLSDETRLTQLKDAVKTALGENLLLWLQSLPRFWKSGNMAVVHAGADPTAPIEIQPENALIWGHPETAKIARTDGIWLVRGHVIVRTPKEANGVISIDTGAYRTGKLTAAYISDGQVTYLQHVASPKTIADKTHLAT